MSLYMLSQKGWLNWSYYNNNIIIYNLQNPKTVWHGFLSSSFVCWPFFTQKWYVIKSIHSKSMNIRYIRYYLSQFPLRQSCWYIAKRICNAIQHSFSASILLCSPYSGSATMALLMNPQADWYIVHSFHNLHFVHWDPWLAHHATLDVLSPIWRT